MKIHRFPAIFFVLTLSLLLLTACQSEKTAWTLNEALQMIGTEQAAALNGRIPLSDDFSGYDAEYSDEYTADSGKIVILWREGAEKKFSRSSTPLPDDYRGEEAGKAKVYLCADLMERIPEHRRAATAEEAKTIIMAESYYYYVSSIEYSEDIDKPSDPGAGKDSSGRADGMNTSEFRPLFNACNAVMLYHCETKGGTFMYWQDYPHEELRDNPEADDLWWDMLLLKDLADAAEIADEQVRFESEMFCAENLYYYSTLPDSALETLYSLIAEDDSEEIIRICTETFWNKAESFLLLDPGFEEEYSAALSAKSYDALAAIVEARSFAFIEMTTSEVMARKAYIGTPEPADLERMLDESLSFLDEIAWNMTDARRILIYGY